MSCSAGSGRALDHAKHILQRRNVRLPAHVCIQADNTAKEQRNGKTMAWLAMQVCRRTWDSASPSFYIVGHTHCEVDQRFPSVITALCRESVLETPEEGSAACKQVLSVLCVGACTLSCTRMQDFAQRVRDHVQPARGRELVVEVCTGFHAWDDFMAPLDVAMGGLTIQVAGESVNHAFRLLRREDLALMTGYEKWQRDMEDMHCRCVSQTMRQERPTACLVPARTTAATRLRMMSSFSASTACTAPACRNHPCW